VLSDCFFQITSFFFLSIPSFFVLLVNIPLIPVCFDVSSSCVGYGVTRRGSFLSVLFSSSPNLFFSFFSLFPFRVFFRRFRDLLLLSLWVPVFILVWVSLFFFFLNISTCSPSGSPPLLVDPFIFFFIFSPPYSFAIFFAPPLPFLFHLSRFHLGSRSVFPVPPPFRVCFRLILLFFLSFPPALFPLCPAFPFPSLSLCLFFFPLVPCAPFIFLVPP